METGSKEGVMPVLRACISKIFEPAAGKDEKCKRLFRNGARLRIMPGDVVVLKGESGCGKSTLIKILGGLMEPTYGFVYWGEDCIYANLQSDWRCREGVCGKCGKEGSGEKTSGLLYCDQNTCDTCEKVSDLVTEKRKKAVDDVERDKLRGKKIAFVFQDHNLVPHFTAMKNVSLGPVIRDSLSDKEIVRKAEECLELVALDKKLWRKKVGSFSGGEKQRVNFARALAADPALIFADEPFSHMDEDTIEKIWKALRRYKEAHPELAIVIISHDSDLWNEEGVYSADASVLTDWLILSRRGLSEAIKVNHSPGSPQDPVPGNCPRCYPKETKMSQRKIGTVTIDICSGCNGIWLDDGELDNLWSHMENFMDQAIQDRLLKVLR